MFTPIFHAILAAVNVFLVIFNYRTEDYLDAGVHVLFVINFLIMFLITVGEPRDGSAD
jgi:hypothetical protein